MWDVWSLSLSFCARFSMRSFCRSPSKPYLLAMVMKVSSLLTPPPPIRRLLPTCIQKTSATIWILYLLNHTYRRIGNCPTESETLHVTDITNKTCG